MRDDGPTRLCLTRPLGLLRLQLRREPQLRREDSPWKPLLLLLLLLLLLMVPKSKPIKLSRCAVRMQDTIQARRELGCKRDLPNRASPRRRRRLQHGVLGAVRRAVVLALCVVVFGRRRRLHDRPRGKRRRRRQRCWVLGLAAPAVHVRPVPSGKMQGERGRHQ